MAKQSNKGFSLVEVMVSVGVLGLGLVGLINLHTSSIMGLNRGQHVAMAQEVAMQETEYLQTEATSATGSLEAVLPTCPVPAGSPVGCLDANRQLAPLKSCSVFLNDPNVPDPSGAFSGILQPNAIGYSSYRMDTVLAQHPDGLNHAGALVVTVSVCWTDESMVNQQLSISRVIVPGT